MNNILGIIGGVGPLASAYFYDLLTQMTEASKDQEHMNIVILSHATIPDRTAYILKESDSNPYPYLLEDVKTLEKMGVKRIVIPCNTSCYFHEDLQKETHIPISNIIEDTVSYIKEKGIKKVMILATKGTLASHLYQDMCKKYGVLYDVPSEDVEEKVMHIIYQNVKSGKKIDTQKWDEIISSSDADAFIMGCTELSVVKRDLHLDDTFIDPLEVEAKILIPAFGKKIREIYK